MAILTCKNHTDLRWMIKDHSWNDATGFVGSARLLFQGRIDPEHLRDAHGFIIYHPLNNDYSIVRECPCSLSDLVRV